MRQELQGALVTVRLQIDRLRARPYPLGPVGFVPGGLFPLFLILLGIIPWCVAPFGTNGVIIDNGALIDKLTETLREINETLEDLGSDDA